MLHSTEDNLEAILTVKQYHIVITPLRRRIDVMLRHQQILIRPKLHPTFERV